MKAFRTILQASQGSITLDLPASFHSRKLEVVVMPLDDVPITPANWPADFFTSVAGAWTGDVLHRGPQCEYETRGTLE